MEKIMYTLLLQCKFFLVEFMNLSYNLVPTPIRRLYLRCFGLKLSTGSTIHRCCKFFHVGRFSMGKNSVINFGCYLDNRRGIEIGNNVGIAHDSKIYTLGHNINSPDFKTDGGPVIIEDNVFLFSNVMVMPRVTIHEGAIVLAGSVVVKDVPAYTIVGGNPAKYVKNRVKDINYTCNYPYWFAL